MSQRVQQNQLQRSSGIVSADELVSAEQRGRDNNSDIPTSIGIKRARSVDIIDSSVTDLQSAKRSKVLVQSKLGFQRKNNVNLTVSVDDDDDDSAHLPEAIIDRQRSLPPASSSSSSSSSSNSITGSQHHIPPTQQHPDRQPERPPLAPIIIPLSRRSHGLTLDQITGYISQIKDSLSHFTVEERDAIRSRIAEQNATRPSHQFLMETFYWDLVRRLIIGDTLRSEDDMSKVEELYHLMQIAVSQYGIELRTNSTLLISTS
ncbi:hypothetical protein GQ42DRAFT_164100 [Ramicandelaber brevisporus]|nr:hypothetical protein GQ42DRAFT_164100 [Ramicandelaber brevisporus]